MSPPRTSLPWWQRRLPSVAVFAAVLAFTGLVTVAVGREVAEVLPGVGKDHLGDDTWEAPLGLHLGGGFQIARVPDCAAGGFTRMALWDEHSRPYWEVKGPPTPLTSFVVGVAPEGFEVVTAYRDPPPDALLRLVAWRKDGGPLGIRFRANDLVETRVVALTPLQRFTIQGFQTARVCGEDDVDPNSADATTTTTLPAEAGVTTTTSDTIVADPETGTIDTGTIDAGTGDPDAGDSTTTTTPP